MPLWQQQLFVIDYYAKMEFTEAIKSILLDAKKTFFGQTVNSFNQLDPKGLNQLVTDIDIATEKFLVAAFLDLIPGSSIIAEEQTGSQSDSKYQWIIDPVDGTTNFIHQVPAYCISVALQFENQTIGGFVLELNRDELFWADDTGAYFNSTPIHVSNREAFADTLIATGFPYYTFDDLPSYLKVLEYCIKNTRGVRRLGSAALDLAYVACGKFDGFFEVGLSPWDVAAGAYIVKQAGGKVYDFRSGDDYIFGGEIIAGSPMASEQLGKVIQDHFGKK
ncbi:MAG: myo-inositol-1(or 4)-monophosphatase [Bacteroidia bacterium]|jgi:myo-inositol-1(or 4)-monophosphatase